MLTSRVRTMLRGPRFIVPILLRDPRSLRYLARWRASLRDPRSSLETHSPWWSYGAMDFVDEHLRQTHAPAVFEYGSGGSTLWLAERSHTLTSVEHDAAWYALVLAELRRSGVKHCSLLLREAEQTSPHAAVYGSDVAPGSFERYARTVDAYPERSLDVVIVDGRSRVACVRQAMRKVRPGGVLVLDDSDRPRYAGAREVLRGWQRHVFWGVRPHTREMNQTTCWRKPGGSPD